MRDDESRRKSESEMPRTAASAFYIPNDPENPNPGEVKWYKPGDEVPDEDVAKISNEACFVPEEYLSEWEEANMPIGKMKVEELKAELANRGMSTDGKKDELVERLRGAVSASADTHGN